MKRIDRRIVLLTVLALGVTLYGAAAQTSQTARPVSQTTLPGSARTLITSVSSLHSNGSQIETLIIWRGTPGWYLKGSQKSSAGGSRSSFNATLEYGDVTLDVALVLDPARSLKIQGQSVDIAASNVVLVDSVDSATGLQIVKTLQIDPSIADRRQLPSVIPPVPIIRETTSLERLV